MTVPAGWTAESWAARLDQLAAACEAVRPDRASEFRKQAAALRAALPVLAMTGLDLPDLDAIDRELRRG